MSLERVPVLVSLFYEPIISRAACEGGCHAGRFMLLARLLKTAVSSIVVCLSFNSRGFLSRKHGVSLSQFEGWVGLNYRTYRFGQRLRLL